MTATTFIVWREDYRVGDDDLDMHHHRMCTIVNGLYEARITNAPDSQLIALFRNALDYAQMHFHAEENMLRSARYPDLKKQEAAHLAYLQRMQDLMRESSVNPHSLSMDIFRFLKEWWQNHILVMDKAYASYLKPK